MTATTANNTTTPPTKNVFRLHGVNVLNRKNVDSISRLTALEKRRATHILDERQRRDTMNQLLAELANLVRESAAEVAAAQQQQQEQAQQLNADGTEKKAPVKSNSITTLRNAITEIRRLRSCAGLETTTPPCAASLAVISPNASRSSSPVSQSSYTKRQQKQQQQQDSIQLPALAPMNNQYSTPASSPKAYASQVPPMAHHYQHQHQLQSPPLSPSSDSHQYHPSSVSPPTMAVHTSTPQLPSLFANYQQSSSSYNYQAQPQYCQQQQQQQYSQQYNYEQSYSRSASPSSNSSYSSSAPSMILPQPYMQQQHYPAYAPM
ncbi:hypothetical protein EC991_003626 [Linnemannia zychae]|nr:hypothetical protein EC991_003626 [Linnemannia zychae]